MYKQKSFRIPFLNTCVDNLTMEEALQDICSLVKQRACAYVVTPNVNHLSILKKDETFRKLYEEADLILTDGKPLIWISRFKKRPIKEKISGSDLLPKLAEMAAREQFSVFLLGAAEGVAKKAADVLVSQNPGLQIAGICSPPFGFETDPQQVRSVIEQIQNAKPDILVLALGSPKQEKFIYRYKNELNVPISLGLGASLDFMAGTLKRAPKWVSDCGLEWLYRICQEPRRLAKRYIHDFWEVLPLLWQYRN